MDIQLSRGSILLILLKKKVEETLGIKEYISDTALYENLEKAFEKLAIRFILWKKHTFSNCCSNTRAGKKNGFENFDHISVFSFLGFPNKADYDSFVDNAIASGTIQGLGAADLSHEWAAIMKPKQKASQSITADSHLGLFKGTYWIYYRYQHISTTPPPFRLHINEYGGLTMYVAKRIFKGTGYHDSMNWFLNLHGEGESLFFIFKVGVCYAQTPLEYIGGTMMFVFTAEGNNPQPSFCGAVLSRHADNEADTTRIDHFFTFLYENSLYSITDEALGILKNILPAAPKKGLLPYELVKVSSNRAYFINRNLWVLGYQGVWDYTVKANDNITEISHPITESSFDDLKLEDFQFRSSAKNQVLITHGIAQKHAAKVQIIVRFTPMLQRGMTAQYSFSCINARAMYLCMEDWNYSKEHKDIRANNPVLTRSINLPTGELEQLVTYPPDFFALIKNLQMRISKDGTNFLSKYYDTSQHQMIISDNQVHSTFKNPQMGLAFGIEWTPPYLQEMVEKGIISAADADFIKKHPKRLYQP